MKLSKCYQKTFRYRLKPTPEQEQSFVQWAGCRRFVWNYALERRRQHYQETKHSLSLAALCLELTSLKRELPWLKEADSQCLQQVLRDLDTAYKNFFEKRAGFPKRKKKFKTPNAFRIPQRVCVEVCVEQDFCRIPKIGPVPMILHRPLEGCVKSATFKQEASGHWYVTFVTEQEAQKLPKERVSTCASPSPAGASCLTALGIDIGLESFLSTSEGDKVEPPRFFRKQQAKIKRANRRFSRKQKGSQNRHRARRKLACVHAKARQQRNDFLHKLSSALVRKHDVLCLEGITIAHAAKTKLRGHSKSWYDAAHGAFRRMLQYKADWQNRSLVFVGKWFPSSQLCSACGYRERHDRDGHSYDLSVRAWTCSCCQTCHDRDLNAAINIKAEGLRLLAVRQDEKTLDPLDFCPTL